MKCALVIGNSDGIGLAVTRALLRQDYAVVGVSKRAAPIEHEHYRHFIQDVTEPAYRDLLSEILARHPDLNVCIYCAGIGDRLALGNLAFETRVFQVNLMAAVVTTELVLGQMIRNDEGHFIGLSSLADAITSADAPSYSASKAALSRYWEGLGLALVGLRVKVTNVRFGFVDTKMAKGAVRPLMLSKERAVAVILRAMARPRLRITKPCLAAVLVWMLALLTRLRIAAS
jgi:short-subunit dehydrogenase